MYSVAPLTILLVEDDMADQKLIKTSLKDQRIANELHITNSGEEALDFLLSTKPNNNGGSMQPDLILLDLNMPGMGGKEFLRQVKEKDHLKHIPVVILTTSNSERDIIDSYRLHAAGYVHKPVSLEEFKQVMADIEDYWFVLCKLPNKEQ